MKYTTAFILASAIAANAAENNKQMEARAFEEDGNWYGVSVKQLKYDKLDISGTYPDVTDMSNGCVKSDKAFSGPIAPYDEGLSVHIRGPAHLKQFAVYTLASSASSSKREEPKKNLNTKRHGHQHLHRKHAEEKRSGELDGTSNIVKSIKSTATGAYVRSAYYDSASQTKSGLVFLGNYGGQGSGVWDTTYGNSLSYLNAAGTGGAASSTCLADVEVGDNVEFSIFSDTECVSGDSCGYSRPGTVAYHGFEGADKVIIAQIKMPDSGNNSGFNANMPAYWFLNSKIPRTAQYASCSPWPNAGELDVVEILTSGNTKAKSTFHFTNSIGNSDYFDRPTSDYMTVATVFHSASSTVTIKILDSSFSFSSSLTQAQVDAMIAEMTPASLYSLMSIP